MENWGADPDASLVNGVSPSMTLNIN